MRPLRRLLLAALLLCVVRVAVTQAAAPTKAMVVGDKCTALLACTQGGNPINGVPVGANVFWPSFNAVVGQPPNLIAHQVGNALVGAKLTFADGQSIQANPLQVNVSAPPSPVSTQTPPPTPPIVCDVTCP